MTNTLKLPPPDGVLEFMDEDGKRSAPAWTEASIRAAIAAASTASNAPPQAEATPSQGSQEQLRVACIGLGGTTLYTPANPFIDQGIGDDDGTEVYTLTFRTMTRAEFDALGEFNGF